MSAANNALDAHYNASGAGLSVPPTDIVGTARPQNGAYDIGAFEIPGDGTVDTVWTDTDDVEWTNTTDTIFESGDGDGNGDITLLVDPLNINIQLNNIIIGIKKQLEIISIPFISNTINVSISKNFPVGVNSLSSAIYGVTPISSKNFPVGVNSLSSAIYNSIVSISKNVEVGLNPIQFSIYNNGITIDYPINNVLSPSINIHKPNLDISAPNVDVLLNIINLDLVTYNQTPIIILDLNKQSNIITDINNVSIALTKPVNVINSNILIHSPIIQSDIKYIVPTFFEKNININSININNSPNLNVNNQNLSININGVDVSIITPINIDVIVNKLNLTSYVNHIYAITIIKPKPKFFVKGILEISYNPRTFIKGIEISKR